MNNANEDVLKQLYERALKELPVYFLQELENLQPRSTTRLGKPFTETYTLDMHKIGVPVIRGGVRDVFYVIFNDRGEIVKEIYELRVDSSLKLYSHLEGISSGEKITLSYDCARKRREDTWKINFPGVDNEKLEGMRNFRRLDICSSYDIKPLSDIGVINVKPEAKLTQLKQLIDDTGLDKQQIMNYRQWLKNAGIFPPHKQYRDNQYSEKELSVLKRLGEHIKEYPAVESVRLSLEDIYGENSLQVQKFIFWYSKYKKKRSDMSRKIRMERMKDMIESGSKLPCMTSADYDVIARIDNEARLRLPKMDDIIFKKLLKDFLSSDSNMLESYPLNLYFTLLSPRDKPPRNHLKSELKKLILVSKQYATFDEYEKDIFDVYVSMLNEIILRVEEPFRIALDRLSKEKNRCGEIIEKRYLQDGKTRTLESVGKDFGTSNEWVRLLEVKAIETLKTYEEIDKLNLLLANEALI